MKGNNGKRKRKRRVVASRIHVNKELVLNNSISLYVSSTLLLIFFLRVCVLLLLLCSTSSYLSLLFRSE